MIGGVPLGLANEPVPADSVSASGPTNDDASLKIISTTNASHVTTNEWAIKAGPDGARVDVARGQVANVAQVVEVTHVGRVLSDVVLGGSITVTNSADAARTATVGTSIPGTTCDVVDGVNRVVPAQGEAAFTFTCAPGADFQPRDSDANTAFVSWRHEGVDHRLDAAAEGLGWDGLYLHNTVDVHDIDGDDLSVLGSLLVAPDGTLQLLTPESGTVDGSVARFAYSVQLDGSPNACRAYTSLAVVAGDGGAHVTTDSASVAVCPRPAAAPGLPKTGN